jgi:hypothetical protein
MSKLKAIGRVIACIWLFLFITCAIGIGAGMHSLSVFPATDGFTDAVKFERVIVIDQFEQTYGPVLIAISFFICALIAFKPRPLTIVLVGSFSVLIFFTAPFPADAPGRSLNPGSFMTWGAFTALNYAQSQSR